MATFMILRVVRVQAGVVEVRAEGPLAPNDPEQLTNQLFELCGPESFDKQIRLDMAEADYISSAGIGGLLNCHKRLNERGGSLVIGKPSRLIRQTLEMLRLGSVLIID